VSTKIDDWPMRGRAIFSEDMRHRYLLTREFLGFDGSRSLQPKTVAFILLNPSTADESVADPTVRRCMTYARDWGYTKLVVLNLFALRSTAPKVLYSDPDPVGAENDSHIWQVVNPRWESLHGKPLIVCAWGTHGNLYNRDATVKLLITGSGVKLTCLRQNADGSPAHPLYLPKNLAPIPFV